MNATPGPKETPFNSIRCVADHDPLRFRWKSAQVSGADAVWVAVWASAADISIGTSSMLLEATTLFTVEPHALPADGENRQVRTSTVLTSECYCPILGRTKHQARRRSTPVRVKRKPTVCSVGFSVLKAATTLPQHRVAGKTRPILIASGRFCSHKMLLTAAEISVDSAESANIACALCQYPQKSTLGLFRIANATTRSTWKPFGSFR